jgi:quinohemoprotein ethanol dehydrogenase
LPHRRKTRLFALAFGLLLLVSCGRPPASDWPGYGRTTTEQRFSPLDDVTTGNIAKLGLTAAYAMRDGRGVEATPLEVDGTLYVTSAWSIVYALDAVTGKERWVFDPKVDRAVGAKACCDAVNRGVGYADGKVFVAALDGRLIAIDATTGAQLWSTQTIDNPNGNYVITGAPRVAKGLVFIGNSGADLGVRGYMGAYDAVTGKQVWRFYTVPGDPAKGPDGAASDSIMPEMRKTWTGQYWAQGGGGTVWDSITYDDALDRIYIGVGNGSPWNRQIRSPGGGDNWFLASIVALDRKTGRYLWHYQTTPGDTWDSTATASIILADVAVGGKPHRVLMQAPKNGFFYVIDRDTGKLLSAKNIVPMAKTSDTPKGAPISWAYGVDMKTGRPMENHEARYTDGKPVLVHPTGMGAHTWQPMAFSPQTGLAYIPAQDFAASFTHDPNYHPTDHARAGGLVASGAIPHDAKLRASFAGRVNARLIAWNPVTQKEVWSMPHGFAGNGGILATAGGLVFQSAATGVFSAYDALTGKRLWSFGAQATAQGGPITYRIGGVQYVAIAIGNGGSHWLAGGLTSPQRKGTPTGRVLIFKLGGSLPYARVDTVLGEVPVLPDIAFSKEQIDRGAHKYATFCAACHGFGAISGQVTPDLRRSSALLSAGDFNATVKQGALLKNGMPKFGSELPDVDVEAIRAFITDEARFIQNEKSLDGSVK